MNDTATITNPQQPLAEHVLGHLRNAAQVAASWDVVHRPATPCNFPARVRKAHNTLKTVEQELANLPVSRESPADTHENTLEDTQLALRNAGLQELRESYRLLRGIVLEVADSHQALAKLPRVLLPAQEPVDEPVLEEELRPAAVAAIYFRAVNDEFSPITFSAFLRELQVHEPLTVNELWNLSTLLNFVLLECLLQDARTLLNSPKAAAAPRVSVRLGSLRTIGHCRWADLIEPLIAFDATLRHDPAGAYESMDFDTRNLYRKRVAFIARHSDYTESQVAQAAIDLTQKAAKLLFEDPRVRRRQTHVGYYLIDAGFSELAELTGFHPPLIHRVRTFIRAHADDFYITGIALISIFSVAAIMFALAPYSLGLASLAITCALLLLPATQDAVELTNFAVTTIFGAQPLSKLDFNKGIPAECTTLVTVPTLLLGEAQVRELANDLEVRFLANRDPHLHFALLTDQPDSVSKPHENDSNPLVELAVRLIDALNDKYKANRESGKSGSFLLLHRHRIYNTRQGVWMGWERKRGKLLDLNKLLVGEFDAFPIKAGPLEALKQVRYILTLDSDTQLPRGSAARLIGAIAHPLNQAMIDPKLRIVTAGYGILQPRVGVTVQSASRSRLAAIFSGQSGLDTYTRAVSDAYQDLYGEGIFTGKGIYEIEALHAVLNRRFPRNALLSHDLIEGAYARAGLATDIEIIDEYPSHYSAYTRRKHRWVRGDWQIVQWIFSRVPEEGGKWVRNPIAAVSRWMILDNLRRSLVEPATFILFVVGWIGLPGGPLFWTLVSLLLISFPTLLQLGFGLGQAVIGVENARFAEAFSGFGQNLRVVLLYLIFLPHHTLLSLDAIFRSLVRRFVTGERLLEWETAAQAESASSRRTPVERYLALMPVFAAALAALIYWAARNHQAIFIAAPILLLWGLASVVTLWLNGPPAEQRQRLRPADEAYLFAHALRIWRYFREFGEARHNYLICDNVEEVGVHEAARVSPTNIGLLLNARQAACELGFLTVPEFADLTSRSLATITRLEKHRGHLFNWYDTQSLAVLPPRSVSSVDSGNFVASLYTLHSGAITLLKQPVLSSQLLTGLREHWQFLQVENVRDASLTRPTLPDPATTIGESTHWTKWTEWLAAADASLSQVLELSPAPSDASWWIKETKQRITALLGILQDYVPWLLPMYAPLCERLQLEVGLGMDLPSINESATFSEALHGRLTAAIDTLGDNSELCVLANQLNESLVIATQNLRTLANSLHGIALQAERIAEETDFGFLVHPGRQLLSIGYDVSASSLHESCYDMLASEARIATFLAIARDELPQQGWFNLGRTHTAAYGRFVLLSWTGTMFEYLMPSIWMRSYPDTLISRTLAECVYVQRAFANTLKIPWGISESGYSLQDESGHYQYHAFGIPSVALKFDANAGPVVSPYSTFLALGIDAIEAISNLRRMAATGWVGSYGFYEAVDYSASIDNPIIVREWMAHHQGMALLGIMNLLCNNVAQEWFHANSLVQATELLLQEVPVNKAVLRARLKQFAPVQST